MSNFVKLNGVIVPTAKGGEISILEFGDRTQAYDGTYQQDTRTRKTQWTYKTKPIPPLQAQMLRGLIQGQGTYFPFDANGYSSAGQTPSGSSAYTALRTQGTTPITVQDENNVSDPYLGAGSVSCQRAVTNLLTAAQSQASDATKGVAVGSVTFTTVTTFAMGSAYGNNSYSCVATAINSGFYVSGTSGGGAAITGATGDRITISCYVFGTALNSVGFQLLNGAATLSSAVRLLNGAWQRMIISFTLTGAATDLRLEVLSFSPGAQTFYVAGLQLEKQLSGTTAAQLYPGSWVLGGTTVPAANLQYTAPQADQGFTFSCWATKNPGLQSEFLFYLSGPSGQIFTLYHNGTQFSLETFNAAGIKTDLNVAYAWDNNWHMVTGVCYVAPTTGATNLYLYVDGSLVGSLALAANALPNFTNATALYVGNLTGTGWWGGRMDEVQVLPFPVDQTWVTGTFNGVAVDPSNLTGQIAPSPYLRLSGKSIHSPSVVASGKVIGETNVGYQDTTSNPKTWRSEGRQISFTLTEV